MNVAGHDADLDFVGRNQAWAVRAEQQSFFAPSGLFGPHAVAHFEHVTNRDALGNTNGQVQIGFYGFPNRSSCASRGDVNHRNCRAGFVGRFFHRGVDRNTKNRLACFFRVHAGDEAVFTVGVLLALLGVELTGFTGNALGDDFGIFVDIDRHGFSFWSRRGR